MGHDIRYFEYSENCDKRKVEENLNNYAASADWQEGCSGLCRPIRWLSDVCADYESAEQYIASHDSGDYDQLAVRFKACEKMPTDKEYATLFERLRKCRDRLTTISNGFYADTVTSEYIGCKGCGSKLSRVHIAKMRTNRCPLCGKDMRSETTLSRIEAAQKAVKEAEVALREKKLKLKKKSTCEIRWLVKIEYHT